ncbi:MAG: site-2 protease family protein [Actinomycetota bacterium]|nr:site-2 protease family protein [Actinomycetota bacterium]
MTRRRGLVLALLGVVLAYALVRRGVVGTNTLLLLAALFGSVILHEVSHGAVALRYGDDTAKKAGRLTLNPVSHVDPVGTVILPAILVLAGASPFGWAKPVPVSPGKLRSPRNHSVLVSLAGPAVNIALALLAAVVLRGVIPDDGYAGRPPLAHEALLSLGVVNVVLAVFNLIPLPPLDGSAVVERLLPSRWWPGYLRVRQYSMAILLVLVLLLPRALDRLFTPALEGWFRLLT